MCVRPVEFTADGHLFTQRHGEIVAVVRSGKFVIHFGFDIGIGHCQSAQVGTVTNSGIEAVDIKVREQIRATAIGGYAGIAQAGFELIRFDEETVPVNFEPHGVVVGLHRFHVVINPGAVENKVLGQRSATPDIRVTGIDGKVFVEMKFGEDVAAGAFVFMAGAIGAGEILLVITQAVGQVQTLEQRLAELHECAGVFGFFFQVRVSRVLEQGAVIVVVHAGSDIHETGVEGVFGGGRDAFGDAGVFHGGVGGGQRVFTGDQLGLVIG